MVALGLAPALLRRLDLRRDPAVNRHKASKREPCAANLDLSALWLDLTRAVVEVLELDREYTLELSQKQSKTHLNSLLITQILN